MTAYRSALSSFRLASSATRVTRGAAIPALLLPRHLASSATVAAEASKPAAPASGQSGDGKKPGIISSLLHGSEKAKREGALLQSHSTTVGRSKYIHEVQKHKIHPQYVDDYKKLMEVYFAKVFEHPELKMRLIGSWEVVVGELDTFVHICEFEGYHGYDFASERIRSQPDYQEFLKALRPMLQSRASQLCREFAFWPSSAPRQSNGIYEMRSYALKPGTLLEWEVEWRRGLEARRQFVEPIGAWFAQVGRLHTVHHMWQYESMDARLKKREQAWQVDTWGKTVSKTVKLCDSMDANILVPLPYSPLR